MRGGLLRFLWDLWLRSAVGDGILCDLHLCADLSGGWLFFQHPDRGGDDGGDPGIHESAAPGLLSCSDDGGRGGDIRLGLRVYDRSHRSDPDGSLRIPSAGHETLHG